VPTGEPVFFIPKAFAVTKENELVHIRKKLFRY